MKPHVATHLLLHFDSIFEHSLLWCVFLHFVDKLLNFSLCIKNHLDILSILLFVDIFRTVAPTFITRFYYLSKIAVHLLWLKKCLCISKSEAHVANLILFYFCFTFYHLHLHSITRKSMAIDAFFSFNFTCATACSSQSW